MKILAIRGKNLASLEGEFEVDFTAEPLKSAGIFAITGPTGSGKSTLLDTLCLALFDDTPRNHRSSDGVNIIDVKDIAISQTDCRNILRRGTSDGYAEVDFVSLGGETYRSRWSVRRSREKVDGKLQGTVITLHNLKTNVEQQGTKTELLKRISELIGLSFDQFTRAVLLAQGDFATFLKAGKNEKADLLEKLTGTDIYSRISASIYEKSKVAEQNLTLLNERIKGIELLSDEDLAAISAEKESVATEMEQCKAQVAVLTAKMKWIIDKELLDRGFQQAQQMLAEAQKAIEEAKPRYDYLARMDSVQEIRDSYIELRNTEKQLADNTVRLEKQKVEKEANERLLAQVTQEVNICEAAQKQHLDTYAELEPQIRQARALDIHIESIKKSLKETRAEFEIAVESRLKKEKSIKVTEEAIKEAQQKMEKIAAWFVAKAPYKDIVARVDLIVNLIEDATVARSQGINNAKILADSELLLDGDVQKLLVQKAEAERLDSLLPTEIVALRAKLVDGLPCPVCGSVHHPASSVEGDSLEEAALDKAKKVVNDKVTQLTEEIEKRKTENIRLKSVIDNYAAQSKEVTAKLAVYLEDLPGWEQLFEEGRLQDSLREVARHWGLCVAEQTKTSEQITNLQTTLQLERDTLTEIIGGLAVKEQKLKTCDTGLAELTAQRGKILSGRSADEVEQEHARKGKEIAEQLTRLTVGKNELVEKSGKLVGSITQLSEEFARLTELNKKVHSLVDRWIAEKNGAITREQLAELLSKDSGWIVTERRELNRLHESKTTAQATLAERQKTLDRHHEAEIKPEQEEDKETLQAVLAEKKELLEQKTKRYGEIELLLANHARGRERLKLFEKELEEKRLLAENWKKLNELFGSADGAKFKILAQGYTLDALLAYANKHLHELSRRYVLQRIPDSLALQVVDLDMLGEVRTVHSLSGGESFLLSLALALGLSSLSSNRMNVESLFIDEGFGSLDADTLRVAMDALGELQTQGRKIGVISHVAEMTERITAQIRVVKMVNGKSTITVVG
ncbi:AAA family ATPase [Bacteroides sp.]